ncbi:MAG: glycosyltransferase [Oscillospiraceae bacterium]|jgi:glycosyltransferase involved in cell wall biosynthesis|nr:glycosyltransferase [Oscillospiraceae bacterium]
MRIIQLLPTLLPGDAVSNNVLAIADVLTQHGFENDIVTCNDIKRNPQITEKVQQIMPGEYLRQTDADVFIYHMAIGSELTDFVIDADVKKKIMIYHNITPAEFYKNLPLLSADCINGRKQLQKLAEHIDFGIGVSEYNKSELDALSYKKTASIPLIMDLEDYTNTKPSRTVMDKYTDDGFVNILFVGRIAPNKKHEDVIASFHVYNRYINPKSRLFLVGSYNSTENYHYTLKKLVDSNGIKNVIFTGHIPFNEIIAYYRVSHLFLCESEHEGFCVPLVEAMLFDLPILAYHSTAIPYTLGNSGIMFTEKNHKLIAELINAVLTNETLKNEIVAGQRRRLEDFSREKIGRQFMELFEEIIK